MPADLWQFIGKIMCLMRILFDVEKLFIRCEMVSIVVCANINEVAEANSTLTHMSTLANH